MMNHMLMLSLLFLLVLGCTPTVKLENPSEPITINLNVKIDHEVVLKVDQELDDVFEE